MSCAETIALGAYLLGSLDPAERAWFERHARTCVTCRREVVRLAPLPGLLGQVQPADLELPFDDPAPTPDLWPLPPLDDPAPAGPTARTRRRRLPLVAAGVLVPLVAVAALLLPSPRDDAPDRGTVSWHALDATSGVEARADLLGRSWGTELWLTIGNVPKGMRCELVVHDRAGRTEIGGWWGTDHVPGDRVPGATSFPVEDIERLDVVVDMKVLVSVAP
ncbi:anti-sigma factor family protein [Saccharothrix yanglingensis]|uniref:Anti-sigma factor n=1 Tax=Saccharothrix yanglingensis TaxID=659496 RepID=A0ABU0X290_9PSEU|nr:zf-HC2 domain-containing protein [Saccharothrix yanglingensis]MDQ2586246.1 anti-sigma factor [Saccharothrix yanglingensis]